MIKECMSGYFQFSSKEDGLYITVYPPKSGYGAASIDDVMFYVDNKNISCDSVKLMEAVRTARTDTESRRQQGALSLYLHRYGAMPFLPTYPLQRKRL